MKKMFLKNSQNLQKTPLPEACSFGTLALAFSYEFCGIFKNTFFAEHDWVTGSKKSWKVDLFYKVSGEPWGKISNNFNKNYEQQKFVLFVFVI